MPSSLALDLQSLPQLSLGTAALVIFAACALFAMLRGMLRLLLGTLTLAAAGYVAYLVWRQAPEWLEQVPGGHLPWLPLALPIAAGIAALVLLRTVLNFASRPFRAKEGEEGAGGHRSPLRRGFALLFSLVPTSALWFAGAAALRHAGSVAEIRNFVEHGGKSETPAGQGDSLTQWKGVIDRLIPAGWFHPVDPFSDQARLTLAKLIALGDETGTGTVPPKAIPVMEEPEIRSLILNDPGLRQLAREKRYADILRDPRLDRIMADPDLRQMLAGMSL